MDGGQDRAAPPASLSGRAGRLLPEAFPCLSAGARRGPTRLPRAEDFRPPKEYREELLKALDEKYPSRDEGLIEDYF